MGVILKAPSSAALMCEPPRASTRRCSRCGRSHRRLPLLAPSLPELALKPDLPERPAGPDDLGVLSDHCLRSRFRFPTPRQAQAPGELARLDRDTAEDREQAPGPGQEDESEHDRNCQRHRVSISPSLAIRIAETTAVTPGLQALR